MNISVWVGVAIAVIAGGGIGGYFLYQDLKNKD